MDQPDRRAPGWGPERRTPFASPALAGVLAVIVVALILAIVLVPGLLPSSAVGPTPLPTTPPSLAPSSSPTASPARTFVRPTPTPAPTFTSYVVRAGDSLNSIARTYRTTARSLAWWNRGAYPNLDPQSATYAPGHIEPGWVLVVMPGVVVDDASPPSPSPGPSLGPDPSPGPSPSPGSP